MARSLIFSPALLSGSLAAQIVAAMRPQQAAIASGENHPVVEHYMGQARAEGITALRNEVLDHIDLDLDHLDLTLTHVSRAIATVNAARDLVLADDYEAASRTMASITPGILTSVADIAKAVTETPEPANLPEEPGPLKRAMPAQAMRQAVENAVRSMSQEEIKELSFSGGSRAARTPCQCPDCADLDGNEDDLAGGVPVFLYIG